MTVCDCCKVGTDTTMHAITVKRDREDKLLQARLDLCGKCASLAVPDTFRIGLIAAVRSKARAEKAKTPEGETLTL